LVVADYGGARIFGRVVVLLLLIVVLAGGGVLWFDYLNVIDAKTLLAPVYDRLPFLAGGGRVPVVPVTDPEILSLDAERYGVLLEALELRNLELDRRQQDIQNRRGEIEQMAQELEERQKALDERENSFNAQAAEADIRSNNVEYNARLLNGMPPERAVGIIAAMDDQLVIDVFRKTEEIAQAEGTTSIVSYWMSLMPPDRAAELQRKMAARPPSLY
jgi:flagellar protein FlbB